MLSADTAARQIAISRMNRCIVLYLLYNISIYDNCLASLIQLLSELNGLVLCGKICCYLQLGIKGACE